MLPPFTTQMRQDMRQENGEQPLTEIFAQNPFIKPQQTTLIQPAPLPTEDNQNEILDETIQVTKDIKATEQSKVVLDTEHSDSDSEGDILKAIEEEKDEITSISTYRHEIELPETTVFSNGVWGNSVLSCCHDIPVDIFVDRT